jgi:hypothetical protein
LRVTLLVAMGDSALYVADASALASEAIGSTADTAGSTADADTDAAGAADWSIALGKVELSPSAGTGVGADSSALIELLAASVGAGVDTIESVGVAKIGTWAFE